MKKQYRKPAMEVVLFNPSALLAGSMDPNGQQDPSMAPAFDDMFAPSADETDVIF